MGKRAVFSVVLLSAIAFVATMWILRPPHRPSDAVSRNVAIQSNSDPPELAPSHRDFALTGRATVIDGDTIEIRRQRIRLHGIDAPESGQTCTDAASQRYLCGSKAALSLSDFVGEATVKCEPLNRDRYGRVVARCAARGEDIAIFLVGAGWALDWPRYSKGEYAPYQDVARKERRGMWSGEFVEPWNWRTCVRGGKRRDVCSL
jgi:endonuclease YncB( thermonuclease family)